MELVKAGRGITIHIYRQSRKTLCGREMTDWVNYTAEVTCKRCLSIHKTNTQLADHATALVAEVNAEIGQPQPQVPAVESNEWGQTFDAMLEAEFELGGEDELVEAEYAVLNDYMAQQPIHPITDEPQVPAVEPSNPVMIYSQPIGMIQWEPVSSRWCNGYYDTQRRAAELARETADTAFAVVDTVTGEVITEYFGSRAIDHPGEFLPAVSAGESQDRELDEVMAAYRVAHQQATSLARIVGVDGPVRFRARLGKRKPSSHRRGW